MKVNLLPFVVEAIGANRKTYKEIDRVYQENKYKYYKLAKEHKLYNHPIIKEGSLVQEEYCKKTLGILLDSHNNPDTFQEVVKIIKKGFRYAWVYVENHKKINLIEFRNAFIRKHKGHTDDANIHIEYYILILTFLAMNSSRELVEDETFKDYIRMLQFRWQHYNDEEDTRIGLEKAEKEDLQKVAKLKQAIYKKYGKIRNFDDILKLKFDEKKMDLCAFLFDYEKISSISLLEHIKFTSKDVDEILYLYVLFDKNLEDIETAAEFLISHMYVKYMIKAYKQVKEMYFENNKETMFVELEGLEKSLQSTTEKLFLAKQEANKLAQQVEALEKENERLRQELEEERKNRNELNNLREFLFSLDKQEEYIEEKTDMDLLTKYKVVLIGGHEKWQQRMKKLLPNFIFIHPDQANFDTKLLEGIDIVFIYVNYLNHGIYYRTMSAIERKNVKVSYINQQNEEMVLKYIYKEIKTLDE